MSQNEHPYRCKRLAVLLILGVLLLQFSVCLPARAIDPELLVSEPELSNGTDAINVAFPGVPTPKLVAPVPHPVPVPIVVPVLVPVRTPEQVAPSPRPLEPVRSNLMVSRMNGEVHFKHLQSASLDPSSRALYIETGAGSSWCELKMQNCTARVWAKSQISVFPETGVIYLKKGAVILQASRQSGAKFSVIAGDFASRVQGAV